MREGVAAAVLAPLYIIWSLAGPVTYVLCVIDTWHGRSSVTVKLLINLTLDAVLAAIWPVTWLIWLVSAAAGHDTPLRVFS